MYLSRVKLDPQRRSTMKALAAPNLFHGAVEQSFSGPRERRLWRVDPLVGGTYLLILSPTLPDLSGAFEQFGAEGEEPVWEFRDYETLLRRIVPGSRWRFRLTANPTVSKVSPTGDRGKVFGHITVGYQEQWLLERSNKHGFSLEQDAFRVMQSNWIRFRKGKENGRLVTLLSVTYEGWLTVTDAELFRTALVNGVGRGKAYGLGMLTVAGIPEMP